ncbi:MAG: hypothetical protein AAGG72_00135 [Pseudomonadota bacterium]
MSAQFKALSQTRRHNGPNGMVTNLSSLGFQFENEADLKSTVERLAKNAVAGLAVSEGDYRIWRSRTGAELWFHVASGSATADTVGDDIEREIIGLTPFFEGVSSVDVTLEAGFSRPGDNAFEGGFQAWVADPEVPPPPAKNGLDQANSTDDADDIDGSYPIVFDCVDYAAHTAIDLPKRCAVRLIGFAREVAVFDNLESFEKTQKQRPHEMADRAFFPVGMFAAAQAGLDSAASQTGVNPTATPPSALDDGAALGSNPPSANALFTGHIIDCQEFVNEETQKKFYWLNVDSLDARYDVVADPECLSGTPKTGAIAQVACVMFGRILGTT